MRALRPPGLRDGWWEFVHEMESGRLKLFDIEHGAGGTGRPRGAERGSGRRGASEWCADGSGNSGIREKTGKRSVCHRFFVRPVRPQSAGVVARALPCGVPSS